MFSQCLEQVYFQEYIRELHDIYDLYTLDDEDVVNNNPHAPKAVPTSAFQSSRDVPPFVDPSRRHPEEGTQFSNMQNAGAPPGSFYGGYNGAQSYVEPP